jgi:hypothetical protein
MCVCVCKCVRVCGSGMRPRHHFPIDVNNHDYMDNYYSLLLDPVRYPTSVVSEWVNQSGHRCVWMCVRCEWECVVVRADINFLIDVVERLLLDGQLLQSLTRSCALSHKRCFRAGASP